MRVSESSESSGSSESGESVESSEFTWRCAPAKLHWLFDSVFEPCFLCFVDPKIRVCVQMNHEAGSTQ